MIDLREQINLSYQPLLGCSKRFLILYGGAGSGKSFFAAQKWLIRIMREEGHRVLALRKVARTIKQSVFALFGAVVFRWGITHLFQFDRSDFVITYKPNGNQIICAGLDDPQKLKSIVGITGTWIEEPTELCPEDLTQINLRLRGPTPFYKQHILSFNPISSLHWLKKRFFDSPDESRTEISHTTYKDNKFIDAEYREELDALEEIDYPLYRVYCLGEWGVLKGVIYDPFPVVEFKGIPDEVIWGLDFGYNNPSSLTKVVLKDQVPYIEEVIYQRKLTTADLIYEMGLKGVPKDEPIYADAAEPDRIEEISRAGYFVLPASKGQGSVNAGISFVRSLKPRVSPSSVNIILENNTYKWRTDKDGNVIDDPAKFCDHAMDSIRYALYTHFGRSLGFEVFAL